MGYEICWESECTVIRRFFGDVTSSDFVNAILDTQADNRFNGLRYVINDYLGIKGFSVTHGDLDYISAVYSAGSVSNPGVKIAVVALVPEVIDLVNRYTNSPQNTYPIKSFDTLASARAWLETPNQHEDIPLRPVALSTDTS